MQRHYQSGPVTVGERVSITNVCVLSDSSRLSFMTAGIEPDQAERLRAVLDGIFQQMGASSVASGSARGAFFRLIEVLESNAEAVVLPADTTLGTQRAADILGVSRMTVVRLIDRGELPAGGTGVHRRIGASDLAEYQKVIASRRRHGLRGLAREITEEMPPDQVIATR